MRPVIRGLASAVALCLAALLLSATVSAPALGQAGQPQTTMSPELQQANDFYQKKDWPNVVKAYTAITAEQPKNARAWYRLGMGEAGQNHFQQAIAAYRKALEIAPNPLFPYNIGCSYARLGQADKAFEWLDRAATAGFKGSAAVKADEDLASLRSDPRFGELIAKFERAEMPCAYSKESRQFDFWLGEWEARTPDGSLAGTSSIQLILGQCVVYENWTGTLGGSGKSLNMFNSAKGKWQQTWADDSGGVMEFVGEFKDGAMRFNGEATAPDGSKFTRRLTFTPLPEGRVRQFSERTTDGGKTWSVEYDLTYSKKQG